MDLQAVIFDLDGVIRHYDRNHERDIEVRFGLAPGTLLAVPAAAHHTVNHGPVFIGAPARLLERTGSNLKCYRVYGGAQLASHLQNWTAKAPLVI